MRRRPHLCRKQKSHHRTWFQAGVCGLLLAAQVGVAEVRYQVSGVDGELAENVNSSLNAFDLTADDRHLEDPQPLLDSSVDKARLALRPFGYYAPAITATMTESASGVAIVSVQVNPGPPTLIDVVNVTARGAGADQRVVREWLRGWPMDKGSVLNHLEWEAQKNHIIDRLRAIGYLGARFAEQRIELDLEQHRADLILTLDTGTRYVIGDIDFGVHMLKAGVLENLPRFRTGDWYSRRLVDRLRLDLWKSGYFTSVDVEEVRRPTADKPSVDLRVRVETTTRNYYQGSLGVGSDTGMRAQLQWSRHPMSSSGDRIDVGIGWQEQDDELTARGSYRLPWRRHRGQYWTADVTLRDETQTLEVRRFLDDENTIGLARGTVDEYQLRLGRLKERNFKGGEKQAFETLFVQTLKGNRNLVPDPAFPDLVAIAADPQQRRLLVGTDDSLSFGIDYDLVSVYGKGWETRGHRDRGWLFTSSESFGSDADFTQLYLSTRRSYLFGDRWKLIVRAEAGYTDADVSDIAIDVNGTPLELSLTRLPNFYRFRAGGSDSVRGYGFEELSNNLIGSNHLITASAEVEMKVHRNWSVATFVDVGNAFNDWNDQQLKKGVGVGLRWYSFAGPIRIDLAQAVDLQDKPWRIHFTVGSPLL